MSQMAQLQDAEDADVDAALGVEPSPVAYRSKSGNLVGVRHCG